MQCFTHRNLNLHQIWKVNLNHKRRDESKSSQGQVLILKFYAPMCQLQDRSWRTGWAMQRDLYTLQQKIRWNQGGKTKNKVLRTISKYIIYTHTQSILLIFICCFETMSPTSASLCSSLTASTSQVLDRTTGLWHQTWFQKCILTIKIYRFI